MLARYSLGHNPTERELWSLMAQVDVDHSGTLDFGEFFVLMAPTMSGWEPEADLGECWRALDPGGRGGLQLEGITSLLHSQGARMEHQELRDMFANQEEEKCIGFDQFIYCVVGT